MGWFLRKSIRLGPPRVNLSKHGLCGPEFDEAELQRLLNKATGARSAILPSERDWSRQPRRDLYLFTGLIFRSRANATT